MFKLPLLRDTVQHLIWDICVEFTFVQRVCLGVSVSDLKRNKPKNLKYFEVRQLQTLVYNHTRQRRRYNIQDTLFWWMKFFLLSIVVVVAAHLWFCALRFVSEFPKCTFITKTSFPLCWQLLPPLFVRWLVAWNVCCLFVLAQYFVHLFVFWLNVVLSRVCFIPFSTIYWLTMLNNEKIVLFWF